MWRRYPLQRLFANSKDHGAEEMKPKAYTIHCSICARVLGISIEKIQKFIEQKNTYNIKSANNKGDEE